MSLSAELLAAAVWPLSAILVALFILRRVGNDLHPVFIGVVGGVAKNATQNSVLWAMGSLYAIGASLQALGDVAGQFGWTYVAAAAKVLQPGLVTFLAFMQKPPTAAAPSETPKTTPPFPTTPAPTP